MTLGVASQLALVRHSNCRTAPPTRSPVPSRLRDSNAREVALVSVGELVMVPLRRAAEQPRPRVSADRLPAVSDDLSGLAARVEELERRMDSVMARLGYLPGGVPIRRDEAQWNVSAEALELASSGKEKDLAKAILLQIKQTGAEPEPARQAVLKALGRDPEG